MRINELREELTKYEKPELREIVVALYKLIPKAKKEDVGLDELLKNFTNAKLKPTKKADVVDFSSLREKVYQLLEYANEQYYLAPNKYVRKEKRSKWRFEVKDYIKQLLSVGGENSEEAAKLLVEIYNMLSYACSYYVFTSEDPIAALKYRQADLLGEVLAKLFYSGYSEETIKVATYLTIDSNVDRETLHGELFHVLLEALKTPDTKMMALKYCVEFPGKYYDYQSSKQFFRIGKTSYFFSSEDYRYREHSNHAAELYLFIKFALQEYDEGIEYFMNNTDEGDEEIVLYRLLSLLWDDEFNDLWIREYEKSLAAGVEPREILQSEYLKRKSSSI